MHIAALRSMQHDYLLTSFCRPLVPPLADALCSLSQQDAKRQADSTATPPRPTILANGQTVFHRGHSPASEAWSSKGQAERQREGQTAAAIALCSHLCAATSRPAPDYETLISRCSQRHHLFLRHKACHRKLAVAERGRGLCHKLCARSHRSGMMRPHTNLAPTNSPIPRSEIAAIALKPSPSSRVPPLRSRTITLL